MILDKGRVAQIGTHLELLSQPGFYRNLFESQFVEEDIERALNLELTDAQSEPLEIQLREANSEGRC